MNMAKVVSSALRSRRTVRIWHFRDSGLFIIGLAQGDDPISPLLGTNNPDTAEGMAKRLAGHYGVEVSNLDLRVGSGVNSMRSSRTSKATNSSLNKDRVVWWMTLDEGSTPKPYVSWTAVGSDACVKMGAMLYSALDTRAVFMHRMGVSKWSDTGLPSLTLIVDSGIDIGPLADVITKRGKSVGVSMLVRARNEE
jgi:hypothetical protein